MITSQNSKVKIFALGGLGEIGKNTYVVEYEDEMVLIDCGIKFPDTDLLGIDYVLSDYRYLKENKAKLKGIFITHGHEDHIGGIPYLLREVQAPIYGGKLAIEFIKSKLVEHKIHGVKTNNINGDTEIKFKYITVRFFRTTHSIADSFGVVVSTPEGNIVHTGDFKFDLTPVGSEADFQKITEISREGVLCLLSDSTNSEVPGYSLSEQKVSESIEKIFQQSQGRIIFATFASHIERIQQVVNFSVKYHRKVAVVGRSMERTIEIGKRLGYIKAPENTFIHLNDINDYKNENVTIICTGSQGEPMAALSRMANGIHRQIQMIPGDTVVISSSPIPGNVNSVNRVINQLLRAGADVIYHKLSEIHASGHGKQEEQKLMICLFNPKYFIPIHGEYRMLKEHVKLAIQCGVLEENCFVLDNGEVLEISSHGAKKSRNVPAQPIYVDGSGIGDIGNVVLRDRRIMSQDGIVIVTLTIDNKQNRLVSHPFIVTRGFVFERQSDELMKELKQHVFDYILSLLSSGIKDRFQLKDSIIEVLAPYLFEKTGRKPMILPVIMEI